MIWLFLCFYVDGRQMFFNVLLADGDTFNSMEFQLVSTHLLLPNFCYKFERSTDFLKIFGNCDCKSFLTC